MLRGAVKDDHAEARRRFEEAFLQHGDHRRAAREAGVSERSSRRWRAELRSAFENLRREAQGWGAEVTRFVGRRGDLETLRTLTAHGGLITLVGPPGIGKTRLAQRHLSVMSREGRSVVFCDLREATNAWDLAVRLADVLDVPLREQKDEAAAIEQIGRGLATGGEGWIVLDNFEQLVTVAAAALHRWLRMAPEARFVVTSRRALRLEGERVFEVGPLTVPAEADDADPLPSEGLELFLDRVRAIDADQRLEDSRTVRALVRALEGVPLALELAASQMRRLSPAELLGRLDGFLAVESGYRDVTPRHRSLRVAIDSSWVLLNPHEREALAQLAVFHGGFTTDAAETVIRFSEAAVPVGDGVADLREMSFLRRVEEEAPDEPRRWDMYQVIHEYAQEALAAMPAADQCAARDRHAAYYRGEGQRLAGLVRAPEGLTARRRLWSERANLERAISWLTEGRTCASTEASSIGAVVDLASSFHLSTERIARGIAVGILTKALDYVRERAAACSVDDALAEARVLLMRANSNRETGAFAAAEADLESAGVVLGQLRTPDPLLEVQRLSELAYVYMGTARPKAACELLEETAKLARASGSERHLGLVYTQIGWIRSETFGDPQTLDRLVKAKALLSGGDPYEELLAELLFLAKSIAFESEITPEAIHACIARAATLEDRWLEASGYHVLGLFWQDRGQPERGAEAYTLAAAHAEKAMLHHTYAAALLKIATCMEELRDFDRALVGYRNTLSAMVTTKDRAEPVARAHLSGLLARRGCNEAAAAELRRARQLSLRGGDEMALALVRLFESRLGLSTVDSATSDSALLRRTVHGRVAFRLLQLSDASPRLLRIWKNGTAFQFGGGPVVDLRAGPVSRRILVALEERRLQAPGEGVPAAGLLALGWPGERVLHRARGTRVRSAVRRLRKLGLGDALLRSKGGYLLDPSVRIRQIGVPFADG